jgi:hypothetical protein
MVCFSYQHNGPRRKAHNQCRRCFVQLSRSIEELPAQRLNVLAGTIGP